MRVPTMRCHRDCAFEHATLRRSRRSFIAGFACVAVLPSASFGAVIVRDGMVVARGRNLGRTNNDPTAHGEMVAIRRCLADHGAAALRGSTLYTSGEPCAMCMGAILWCHLGRLVFAASVAQLATKINQLMLSSADVAAKASFAPISITGGVLADEAMALFVK